MIKQRKSKTIINIITTIILIVALYFAYQFYQGNNFNDFVRGEMKPHTSEFKRDNDVKYSDSKSYRIISNEFNDAMFYQAIPVEKNTPYKVTCMVKTEDVVAETMNNGIGAQIAIEGTTERSVAISGTKDWQKIELLFNSKDRETVNIGFRLGGYLGNAKGKAWFSDFTMEVGASDTSNEWNFACFIFQTTDVVVDNKEVKLSVTQNDISDINQMINRFQSTCATLSYGKMRAKCDVMTINEPITSLSYDNQFGYYVAPEDIEEQIKETVQNGNYDHIFAIIRLGDDEHKEDIEIKDWIGLGSMDYYGIGFSNIRLPNDSRNYIYKYNYRINTFPEEVLLHEFLHSLERTSKECGYEVPALHDYQQYGYKEDAVSGQKDWYEDYMNKNIKNGKNELIGLPKEVYTIKPAKQSNFEYSSKLDVFKEPQNLIEEIRGIFSNIFRNIEYITN